MVSEYHKSGESISEFARSKNIAPQTLWYHVDKRKKAFKKSRRKMNGTNGHAKNTFIDLTAKSMIELETKQGTILRLPTDIDPVRLLQIIEVLK